MHKILILGAGRSATSLIQYLLRHAGRAQWSVLVADIDLSLAQQKLAGSPFGQAVSIDIVDEVARKSLIQSATVVISMLPPHMHLLVAFDCLHYRKHLLTASYLSAEMRELDLSAREKQVFFLNEMGLDPGIDHMSAKEIIDQIHSDGGKIQSFRSYTGGLINRASDDNPWHYKITWNPRNVVMAGSKTAVFLEDGQIRFLPCQQLFENAQVVKVHGGDSYEMYPNRDSISYIQTYGLEDVRTIIRGTLRHIDFCRAWSAIVRLGLTDDDLIIKAKDFSTYRELLEAFLPGGHQSLTQRLFQRLGTENETVIRQIDWLFDDTPLLLSSGSVADHLQQLLINKWVLKKDDRDLVVMYHEIEYEIQERRFRKTSTLQREGTSMTDTAMTELVGLPLAICTRLLLEGKLKTTGVHTPVLPEIYRPVLHELRALGIFFMEQTTDL